MSLGSQVVFIIYALGFSSVVIFYKWLKFMAFIHSFIHSFIVIWESCCETWILDADVRWRNSNFCEKKSDNNWN